MPSGIITNNRLVVILVLGLLVSASGCSLIASQSKTDDVQTAKKLSPDFEDAVEVGKIRSSQIRESSGVAASRCQEGVLWTHNDSGDGNKIFAINRQGKLLGVWRVTGAKNRDWEDIATRRDDDGRCFLYIGDVGNNSRMRSELRIYVVEEPKLPGKRALREARTKNARVVRFSYPDIRHDSETVMVHPETGEIYVVSKRLSGRAGVYKIPERGGKAKKVGSISVPSLPNGLLTGGDIHPNGRRVILCDYFGGYEYALPENAKDFDAIWKEKPAMVDLGIRAQGEAVAYSSDGMSVIATSEKRNSPINETRRKE